MKKKFLPFINRRYAHVFGLPPTAGDFTASEHLEFLLKAEEEWQGGKYEDDLVPHVDALLQILNAQTARFKQLDDPDKDNVVKLTWIKTCNLEDEEYDREDDCAITGEEMYTDANEYVMDMLRKATFSINEEKLRVGTYTKEELIAKGLMRQDKKLSEWLCKQYLLFLKANAGANIPAINGVVNPFVWDDADTTTNIPAADYDVKIIASLIKQQKLNMIDGALFINSGTLFEAWTNAGLDSGNLDGKGDDLRLKQINLAFDMWNMGSLTEDMFMVNRNSVAIKTYTRYSDTPVVLGGAVNQTRYRMKSNILPNVYWDVIYMMTCTAGKIMHTWQLSCQAGMWLNPTSCPVHAGSDDLEGDYTPSGIYSFTQVP